MMVSQTCPPVVAVCDKSLAGGLGRSVRSAHSTIGTGFCSAKKRYRKKSIQSNGHAGAVDLREKLPPFYIDIGRPSIDPELMIRMLIVGHCHGIRFERKLCEEVKLHLGSTGSAASNSMATQDFIA
jgi:hypothetical protein